MLRFLNILKNNPIVYLGYFIKITNWKKLKSDIRFVHINHNYSIFYLIVDMIASSLKLGTSFHEYFYHSFVNKNKQERKAFASMAYMYEYQLLHNPKPTRYLIENKHVFLKEYADYIGRKWLNISISTKEEIDKFIKGRSKVVLKNALGGAGKSVKILSISDFTIESLLKYAKAHDYDLIEEFVSQHKALMNLSPNSLNTIRLITQINKNGEVDVIGTILRMGIDLNTDNLSTGGIACPINTETGVINGPGVSFDITKPDYYEHPVSKITLIGFQIPFWKDVVTICEKAALLHPVNKSIGWDVAIKDEGPLLLEGNHDWGARLWQMPVKRGLKHVARKYFM